MRIKRFGQILFMTTVSALMSFAVIGGEKDGMPSHQGEIMKYAVESGDKSTLKNLMADGLDINVPYHGDGTMLMLAVRDNNPDLVNWLIEQGADVNQPSSGDGNPLIIAAANGNLEIAKRLLGHGADVNAIVEGDETPLINASRNGHLAMVKYLVENGADVNLKVRVPQELRSPLNQARTRAVRDYLKAMGATR